jgi:hypothetical protein
MHVHTLWASLIFHDTELFNRYIQDTRCRRVFFAAGGDPKYASMLDSKRQLKNKIILLRSALMHPDYQKLGLITIDCNAFCGTEYMAPLSRKGVPDSNGGSISGTSVTAESTSDIPPARQSGDITNTGKLHGATSNLCRHFAKVCSLDHICT